MKIIGHRGAAGLAPENTLAAIRAGVKANADFIEFDVRVTRDNQMILSHDPTLSRMFGINKVVAELTLKEIRKVCPEVPTLPEALRACANTDVIIDIKVAINPKRLMQVFCQFSELNIQVASLEPGILKAIKAESPKQMCYLVNHWQWRKALRNIRAVRADGLCMHYMALNPFVYYIARHRQVSMYVYPLNRPWLAKIYSILYPRVAICTDNPTPMINL